MNIKTEHLLLRPFVMSDAAKLAELIAEPKVMEMLEQPPWPYQLSDAKLWLAGLAGREQQNDAYKFAITHPSFGLIGSIGLQKKQAGILDLGYWVGKPYWGKGYASEAAAALMDWAITELGVTELVSGYFEDNPASGAILRKLGFVSTGNACNIENALRTEPIACLGMKWHNSA
ncbi:MAG: GNAT family N-acetyltransferase [Robiginitomaculum sp.]|nr:GNAT family N-acetyltransferase [Robiginitomaculum sp.]